MPTLAQQVAMHQLSALATTRAFRRGYARGQLRVKSVGRPRYPHAIERRYVAELRNVAARAKAVLKDILLPAIPDLAREADVNTRADAYPDTLSRLMRLVRATTAGVNGESAALELARVMADQVNVASRRDVTRMMAKAVGVNIFLDDRKVPDDLRAFVQQNVSLITSISEDYHKQVENKLLDGLRKGQRVEDLQDVIEDRYKVPAARAELIARDQVGKFFGQLAQLRQEELGITTYVWRGVLDERERDSHRELEGTVQRWSDPPITNDRGDQNHPGGDYQCRCTAEPVINLDKIGASFF